jgi:hypothetical protein
MLYSTHVFRDLNNIPTSRKNGNGNGEIMRLEAPCVVFSGLEEIVIVKETGMDKS